MRGHPLHGVTVEVVRRYDDEESALIEVRLLEDRGAYHVGDLVELARHEVLIGPLPSYGNTKTNQDSP